MKTYKLIKEYPGSPELGTVCEERNNKSSFCYYFEGEKNIGITKDQVENHPDFWEEVKSFPCWMVFTKADTSFETYKPYKTEIYEWLDKENKIHFDTEEEAKAFIIFNKPCLSYNDIKEYIQLGYTSEGILSNIYNIVKSKI